MSSRGGITLAGSAILTVTVGASDVGAAGPAEGPVVDSVRVPALSALALVVERVVVVVDSGTPRNAPAEGVHGLLGLLHVAVSLTIFVPLLAGVHPRMASHRAGRSSTAVLEPPGLLGLNYGGQTPVVTIAAHLIYGIALGVLLQVH